MDNINLEVLTLKELRQEVVKLGFPEKDAENFKVKANLISTIKAMQAREPKRVTTLTPKDSPKEEKQTEVQWKNKAERQREYWASQPKVKILVPLEGKETQGVVKWVYNPETKREEQVYVSGAIQPVTENGAQWLVPKGIYVDVPEPVAKLIEDKFLQTSKAGSNLLIDRIDPETGKPVRDQLTR